MRIMRSTSHNIMRGATLSQVCDACAGVALSPGEAWRARHRWAPETTQQVKAEERNELKPDPYPLGPLK